MRTSLRSQLLMLVAFLSGLFSASNDESITKYVCQGDYVQVFQNIALTSGNIVNLYINGRTNTLIGTWHSDQTYSILPEYNEKVFLDKYGSIWIRNIQRGDGGRYVLHESADSVKTVVKINVMVAPTKQCKPNIRKMGNILMTSLKAEDCGWPTPFVHWLNHPDISVISDSVASLLSDNEVGNYIACAKTRALRCVEDLHASDYCTTFTIGGQVPSHGAEVQTGRDKDNGTPVSSEVADMKIFIVILVSLVSSIVFAVILLAAIKLIRKRKNGENANPGSRELVVLRSFTETVETKSFTSNENSRIYQDQQTSIFAYGTIGRTQLQQSLQQS